MSFLYSVSRSTGNLERKVPLSQIGLFKKEFLREVREPCADLGELLYDLKDWNTLLEGLRHPIAHRILIYAVPALPNDDEAAEH